MPKKTDSWEAEDGTLFKTECEAATRDVELIVAKSPLAENQPYAKKLVDWLTSEAKTIRAVLEAHERACPKAAKDQASSQDDRGTRSSGEHQPYCQSLDGLHPCDCGAE